MSFSIITTDFFERELKHLAKKYPSIKNDMAALVEQLLQQPSTGTPIGNDCYKIRLAIAYKGQRQIRWRKGYYTSACYQTIPVPAFHL